MIGRLLSVTVLLQDVFNVIARIWSYLTRQFTFGRITVSVSSVIVGTVVLIDYELGQTQTDKAGKIKAGDGKAIIYVIPPANKRNLTLPTDPNFLADRAKVEHLKQKIVGQGLLAAGSTGEGMVFKFEVE